MNFVNQVKLTLPKSKKKSKIYNSKLRVYYDEDFIYIIYFTVKDDDQVIIVYSLNIDSEEFNPKLFRMKPILKEEYIADIDSCTPFIGYTIKDVNVSFLSLHKNNVLKLWIIHKELAFDEFKLPETKYTPQIVACTYGKVAIGYDLIENDSVLINIKIFGCLSSVNRFHYIDELNFKCKKNEYNGISLEWSLFESIKPILAIGYGKVVQVYSYEYCKFVLFACVLSKYIPEPVNSLIWTLNGNIVLTCNKTIICFSSYNIFIYRWIVPKEGIESKFNHTIFPRLAVNNILCLSDKKQLTSSCYLPHFIMNFFDEGEFSKVKYLISFLYKNTIDFIRKKKEDEELDLKEKDYVLPLPYIPLIDLISSYNELEPFFITNKNEEPVFSDLQRSRYLSMSYSEQSTIFDDYVPVFTRQDSSRLSELKEDIIDNKKGFKDSNNFIRENIKLTSDMIKTLINELPVFIFNLDNST